MHKLNHGVTLLQTMLVVAIISGILVASLKAYNYASNLRDFNSALNVFRNFATAVAANTNSQKFPNYFVDGVMRDMPLPPQDLKSAWGGTLSYSDAGYNRYCSVRINFSNMTSDVCNRLFKAVNAVKMTSGFQRMLAEWALAPTSSCPEDGTSGSVTWEYTKPSCIYGNT